MDDTIISRPSHYQLLGIHPAASAAEIEQAFARRISLFTPSAFGNVTQFGIAYQTLRDPVKREQYDRSIGIEPRPRQGLPSLRPGQMMFIAAQHRDAPEGPPAERALTMHPAAPEPAPAARLEPAVPPAASSAIDRLQTELLLGDILSRRADPSKPKLAVSPAKRAALAAGGLVAAVALLGAWAGWQAGNDVEPTKLETAVDVALPRAQAAVSPQVLTVPDEPYAAPAARPGRRHASTRWGKVHRPSERAASGPASSPSTPEPTVSDLPDPNAPVSPIE